MAKKVKRREAPQCETESQIWRPTESACQRREGLEMIAELSQLSTSKRPNAILKL